MTAKSKFSAKARREGNKDMREATVRDDARLLAIKREQERLYQAAEDAAAVAAKARTVAEARQVFRETLGHKIRRWIGF